MKIIAIDLPDAETAAAATTVMSHPIEGNKVTRFNEARDAIKLATETINELRPDLLKVGMQVVFEYNCDNATPVSSVNLTEDKTGEIVQFSWSKKNNKNNHKQVATQFEAIRNVDGKKVNVNDYTHWVPVADFDVSVFMVKDEFDKERYAAYMEALEEVSTRFGVKNPLTCVKVLEPRADFHTRRWQDFDLKTNLAIQVVLPTTLTLEAIRPEPKSKK